MDQSLAATIRERADVVGQLGAYIGLFEWCAVAVSKRRSVVLWFGEQAVDVLSWFCPDEAAELEKVSDRKQPLNIIASVVDEGLTLMAQGLLPNVNHYLAAIPLQARGPQPEHLQASRDSLVDIMKKSAEALRVVAAADTSLRVDGTTYISDAYRCLGLAVVTTTCQGDCGPDAACCLELRPRTPGGWKAWREELRRFIHGWSTTEPCQECFKACQEIKPASVHRPGRSAVAQRVEIEETAPEAAWCAAVDKGEVADEAGDESEEDEAEAEEDKDADEAEVHEGEVDEVDEDEVGKCRKSTTSKEPSSRTSKPEDVQGIVEKFMGHSFDDCPYDQLERFRVCRQQAVQRVTETLKKLSEPKEKKKRRFARVLLSEKKAIGQKYLAFSRAARKRCRKGYLKQFIQDQLGWEPVQKIKDFVIRCSQMAIKCGEDATGTTWEKLLLSERNLAAVPGGVNGAVHRASGRGRKRLKERYVVLSFQGRPELAPALSELLFQWFVDIRGSIKGRLPHKTVLQKARMLTIEYFQTQLRMGEVPRIPKVDGQWICRWKRQRGISFRKPNKRYKVSFAGILIRLRIFWLNNMRVRYFSLKLSERNKALRDKQTHSELTATNSAPGARVADPSGDIGKIVDQADQKPWHSNEAGSKSIGTLEIKGAKDVPLKEDHAGTRTRQTIFTWCTTNDQMISERKVPLEVCFKFSGGGERVIEGLNLPDGSYSVRGSTSGSYQEVHVFLFLEEHLPIATPERQRNGDWRLFYLDLYAGHLSLRIWELCWDRMYVLLYHGGGCTGLTQFNDVWLHWLYEHRLLEVEQAHFNSEMLLRPHKIPTIDRQALLQNAIAVWETMPHERSKDWAKKTGVSIDLNGKEDTRGKKKRSCSNVRTYVLYCDHLHCAVHPTIVLLDRALLYCAVVRVLRVKVYCTYIRTYVRT